MMMMMMMEEPGDGCTLPAPPCGHTLQSKKAKLLKLIIYSILWGFWIWEILHGY